VNVSDCADANGQFRKPVRYFLTPVHMNLHAVHTLFSLYFGVRYLTASN
jgi:hypothetical protein